MDELHQTLLDGRYEQARDVARVRLGKDPGDTYARATLGVALQHLGDLEAAAIELGHACSENHLDVGSRYNLALVHEGLGELEQAIDRYRDALALDPHLHAALLNLGRALNQRGDRAGAEAAYRRALDGDEECGIARHMLAALTEQTTSAAPHSYVRALFDAAAPTFDEHLAALDYQIPQQLFRQVETAGLARGQVLDLGCGTGLFGAEIAGSADYLAGVDVSPPMLERARAWGDYDELKCADIIEFVDAEHRLWDLVVACDVFVYVGELEPVFRGVQSRLSERGGMAISIECHDGERFVLRPSGRYAHAASYVCDVARGCGLALVAEESIELRRERGEPVLGSLLVFQLQGRTA